MAWRIQHYSTEVSRNLFVGHCYDNVFLVSDDGLVLVQRLEMVSRFDYGIWLVLSVVKRRSRKLTMLVLTCCSSYVEVLTRLGPDRARVAGDTH